MTTDNLITVAELVRALQSADPSGEAVVDFALFDEDKPNGDAVMWGETDRCDCKFMGVMETGRPTVRIRAWVMRVP